MWHKLQYVMMLVPVVIASFWCFSAEPVSALPIEQVVAFEFSVTDTGAQEATVEVAQADDMEHNGTAE